ncbi:long-chain-fatty-acid--CoA ligase [Streptomyces bingchenggensis BCW-1]|uniref:Long-chain-fatty-acid--CoA ligase n=1 Tax=Streptomyces bingchenggensis (strain BCW-1) TaxID=749414 RepID=D7BW61_STRBB|nr:MULTISPECIES: long-chain fatty acid--CoA ligase [Streptomyces]ADI11771.1 long-chain-fatty-acid--CoA ligase [Streptomyces bingchenggensis BCW-1]
MKSTMMDRDLQVSDLMRHGQQVHAHSRVVRCSQDEGGAWTFAETAERAERLAAALTRLGVQRDDRVATLCWNTPEHMAAYLAVPSMGAVLHTLNLRLHPDQLGYIIEHAEDRVLVVDSTLLGLLGQVRERLATVGHVIVVGEGAPPELPGHINVHDWDDLLAAEQPGFPWPSVDERSAAALCYTTGTTGDPKGVAYSHRSILLHTLGISSGNAAAMTDRDRLLPVVPMFHANAWGWPYAGWLAGADLIMNGRHLHVPDLARIINEERPTAVAAVPTLWNGLFHHGEQHPLDLSSVRLAGCGGSSPSRALVAGFKERYGIQLAQGWGMTEASPLASWSAPPRDTAADEDIDWLVKSGRVMPLVEVRVMGMDGIEQPWDGKSPGELQLRGPWVTGSYLHTENTAEKFDGGWLRTGDLGTVEPGGWIVVRDRLKDGIKSGGEWISTVELENAIAEHAAVVEATVVGIPDPKWGERPLACVSLAEGAVVSPAELRDFLKGRVTHWWIPERWTFLDAIPKTSVGKYDKRAVRQLYRDGAMSIEMGGTDR